MKHGFTILIILAGIAALGQDNVAIIRDKDGFANVRASGSASSAIVGKVKDGEFFTFEKTADNWWKIYKPFDGNGSLSGFVHESRIQPLHTLSDAAQKKIFKDVFDKELASIKTGNSREEHHEPKFDMILNAAAAYMSRTKDTELFRTFVETVKLDTGSADEMPSDALGSIFIKQPDWTIEQIKAVGPTEDLINRLEFGFENVSDKSDDYKELKSKIDLLR